MSETETSTHVDLSDSLSRAGELAGQLSDMAGVMTLCERGPDATDVFEATYGLVTSLIEARSINASDVPGAILMIGASFRSLATPEPGIAVDGSLDQGAAETEVRSDTPAVAVENSVTDDEIISLIDGRPYKALKRHLTAHGLTPDSYRARYGLPANYPMVAPAYTRKRSALAKAGGLGKRPRLAAAA